MPKRKPNKTIKKSLPKTRVIWFLVTLIIVAISVSIFFALNYGTGPFSSYFAPAGINLIGSAGGVVGVKTAGTLANKTGNGSTVTKNTNGTTTTTTVTTHTDMSDARNAEAGESFTIPKTVTIKSTTTDANNNIVSTTNTIADKTFNNKGEQVGNTAVAQRTIEFKPGTKNPKDGDVSEIVKSGAVTKTTITSGTIDPKTNTASNIETKSFAPGQTPVLKTTSSSTSNPTNNNKVNCDAGMCGTKGSPVCSGAYVFTGGNSTSSKDSDGTYGCVQCNGGSFSSEVKDCNKLIADGAPVVLPYDANNKWLSSVKTEGMTAPCFINRGGTWVQAAVGQSGEGVSTGKVCDGNGKWVDPPKNATTTLASAGSVHSGVTPVKKTVCDGGTMAGLVLDAYAVASGKPLGIITGTIDGVKTVINCANKDNPAFSFCHSKKGFDKNGICQPDADTTLPPNSQIGGTINLPVGEFGAYVGLNSDGDPNASVTVKGPSKVASTAIGATIGGSAGLLCGPLVLVCAPAGAVVGGWIGNMLGTSSNDTLIGGDIKAGPLGGAGAQINADQKDGLSAAANLQTPSDGVTRAVTVGAGGAALLTPAGIPAFVAAAGGVVSQIAGPVVVQAAKDHPVITGFGTGCLTGATVGLILGPIGSIGGCVVGSVVGAVTGYNLDKISSPDGTTTPTTPSSEKSKDDSGLITPTNVAQGGSGLNTGPVNQITTTTSTAGQPGGNSFTHFYQGDYGNGIKENGCYLTTGAMIIANYGTVDRGKNPQQLNEEYLNGAPVKSGYINVFSGNAYDKNGIKLVNASKEAYGNVPTYVASHATSDQPITLAIYCDSCAKVGHFVLAVGKNSNGEPLIYDPLKKDQTTPIALNSTNYPGLNFQTTDVFLVETSH